MAAVGRKQENQGDATGFLGLRRHRHRHPRRHHQHEPFLLATAGPERRAAGSVLRGRAARVPLDDGLGFRREEVEGRVGRPDDGGGKKMENCSSPRCFSLLRQHAGAEPAPSGVIGCSRLGQPPVPPSSSHRPTQTHGCFRPDRASQQR